MLIEVKYSMANREYLRSMAASNLQQLTAMDALFLSQPADGTDNVVGLIPVLFEDRYAKRRHKLLDPIELVPQFRRGRLPLGFVGLKTLMAEGRRPRIEGDGAVGWIPILKRAQENIDKTINTGGVFPGGGY